MTHAPHAGVAVDPQTPLPSQLPLSVRFCSSLPTHWYCDLTPGQALPLALNRPAAVSQQVPLLQLQVALKSAQQSPADVQTLSQKHTPLLDLPPQELAHEPAGTVLLQVGLTEEPLAVHTVPEAQLWTVFQTDVTKSPAAVEQPSPLVPLQPAVMSRCCTSWPLHWYCVDTGKLPHTVLAGLIVLVAASQQVPVVQQPGLALGMHRPRAASQLLSVQGLPEGAQSASLRQQPCWMVPAHLAPGPHVSLNVQGLPSLQPIPLATVHWSWLASESHTWQPLAAFWAPCDWQVPLIKHHPALVEALHSPLLPSQIAVWQGLGSWHSATL